MSSEHAPAAFAPGGDTFGVRSRFRLARKRTSVLDPPRRQQTIAAPACVDGVGYWTGAPVRVKLCPAAENAGIRFVRTDLPGRPEIPALVENRIEALRRSNLRSGGAEIQMVEHVLAALAGLGIDNCRVEATSAELPGLDGSSAAYVQAILDAGVTLQRSFVRPLVVQETIRVGDGDAWVEARPSEDDQYSLDYVLEFEPGHPIPDQAFSIRLTPHRFALRLAAARTFVTEDEARQLHAAGLARHVSTTDLLVFGPHGPIENRLRYDDECVRHKTLDLIGDLALCGRPIRGSIVAYRSGHRLNAALATELLRANAEVRDSRCGVRLSA